MFSCVFPGLRLIGYAHKDLPSAEEFATSSNEDGGSYAVLKGTVFLGFLGFQDPVKYGVAKAVKTCQEAGVRVIMVTGDHVKTALAVATSVGILSAQEYEANCNTGAVSCTDIQLVGMVAEDIRILLDTTSVFARATAADKLTILEALQASKKCVLVTGDGMFTLSVYICLFVMTQMLKFCSQQVQSSILKKCVWTLRYQ